MSATRRAILAAPVVVAALPQAAAAAPTESCLDLGLRIAGLVREDCEAQRHATQARRTGADPAPFAARAAQAQDIWIGATDDLLLTRMPRTVADVQAKLVAVLDRVNYAKIAEEEEPCLEAAEGLRQCLLALSALTGVSLPSLAADFFDLELGRAIARRAA